MKKCYKCDGDHHYSACPNSDKEQTTKTNTPPQNPSMKQGNVVQRTRSRRKLYIGVGALAITALALTQCFNDEVEAPKKPDLSAKYPSIAIAALNGSYLVGVGKDKNAARAAEKAKNNCRPPTTKPSCRVKVQSPAGKPTCITYTTIPRLNQYKEHVGQIFKSVVRHSKPSQTTKDNLCTRYEGNDFTMCRGRVETQCNF